MTNQIVYNISIEPNMTGGSANNGKFLILGGTQRIDSIIFQISGNTQQTFLLYQGKRIFYYPDGIQNQSNNSTYNPIIFEQFNVSGNILNPVGSIKMKLRINDNQGINAFASPFCDLFRENDIVRISQGTSSNINGFQQSNNLQQIFVGSIEAPLAIPSDITGTSINLTVGYLTNILSRSQLVQTQSNQTINGTVLVSQVRQYQFGELITQLINETYINQTATAIKYYGGITNEVSEKIATGKPNIKNPNETKGSAINAKSWIFAATPPTGFKLDCLLQILYPYQRVFYVDPLGNFTITPLSTYFDPNENWVVDLFKNTDAIPLLGISLVKNTSIIQNRAYCTFNQFFTQFNKSDINGNKSASAYSVATPPQDIFPRAYDFVQSGLALQTLFDIETVDSNNILQNSGLLNTAVNMSSSLPGMKCVLKIDNQNTHINNSDTNLNWIKYLMSLYASRKLAESLFQDMAVNIAMPTVSTYSSKLGRFRNIPLNQMIKIPPVNNNNFDGLTELFCYGFNLEWDINNGSVTTLNLCKPYVFTALWCDRTEQI